MNEMYGRLDEYDVGLHGGIYMATDTERREVARRLRGQAKKLGPNMDAPEFAHYTADVIDVNECMTWYEMELHLADLIEPSCDRDTPQKVAEEMFGDMRHSTKEEADAYEAMLKSKSVELHPVDRDALLALADEMQGQAYLQLLWTLGYVDVRYLIYYARRIREALGVK